MNIALFSKRRAGGLKEEQGNSCFDTEVNLFLTSLYNSSDLPLPTHRG